MILNFFFLSQNWYYLALLYFFFSLLSFIFQGRKINREEEKKTFFKKKFFPYLLIYTLFLFVLFFVDKQRFGILLLLLYPHKQINMGLINETKKKKIWQISGLLTCISISLA
jgi:hypothetical protein